ncbi:hypothetical protein B4135_2198 [Caldibacillus debilis]|uniref:Uncharacterized protein n=1 Tax=Caldibacillus debilis TaxID=301148 RepID=A0A150M2J6_9BACI|nr:hypothetical protein B4135_2198 [Caldibacillus debilis]
MQGGNGFFSSDFQIFLLMEMDTAKRSWRFLGACRMNRGGGAARSATAVCSGRPILTE